jgi:hypothetical protein
MYCLQLGTGSRRSLRSVALATVELAPEDGGTRLTDTEHNVLLGLPETGEPTGQRVSAGCACGLRSGR